MSAPRAQSARGRARALLVLGALAGIALAALALLRSGPMDAERPASGVDAVAWVEGEPIPRETFARFLGLVARERGVLDLDAAERRALLDRLVDEELLLREGLALGLARREPGARCAIVSAVIDGVTSADGAPEPDRVALEALYDETREQWLRHGSVAAEAALVPVPPGGDAAADMAARVRALAIVERAEAGASLAALAAEAGLPPEPPLPAAPIPLPALRERLAGVAVEALLALEPGAVSEPVRSAEGWWVVRLLARGEPEAPPLAVIAPELRNLWLQRHHEERLRAHLAELRSRAEIRIVGEER